MRKISLFLATALLSSTAVTAAMAYPAIATSDLNVRTGPGTGYRVVTTLAAGQPVEVVGCSGSWCQVDFGGGSGFASAGYLATGGSSRAYRPPVVVTPPSAYYVERDYYDRRNFNYRDDGWGYSGNYGGYRNYPRERQRRYRGEPQSRPQVASPPHSVINTSRPRGGGATLPQSYPQVPQAVPQLPQAQPQVAPESYPQVAR